MFHSDVGSGFDLDTGKEERKNLTYSVFLMLSHWKPGKSIAQIYTALSDKLMKSAP